MISSFPQLKLFKKTLLEWIQCLKNVKKSLKNKSLKKYKQYQNIIKTNKLRKEPIKISLIRLNKNLKIKWNLFKLKKEPLKTAGEKFMTCLKSMLNKTHFNTLKIKMSASKMLIVMINNKMSMKFHSINGIFNLLLKNQFHNCKVFKTLQDN